MPSTTPSLINRETALAILSGELPLYRALSDAAEAREKYFGKTVRIQILDNIKNGACAENCCYCAQRSNATGVENYPLKDAEAIFADAQAAKEAGAYRFCMVTSGTAPSMNTTEKLTRIIRRITEELNLRVCLSAGFLDLPKAVQLKEAGLDRYNHNLNTSEKFYKKICTTHTFADRVDTIETLNRAGVSLCSGVIIGMGESREDIIDVAFKLKALSIVSIPVNFFIPVPGHAVENPSLLTPEFCLRALIVFRLVNPDSEIRMAAGREGHLRGLQSTALMVANSLFASGYLNVKGSSMQETLTMVHDAGYMSAIESGAGEAGIPAISAASQIQYNETNFPELLKFPQTAKP